MAKPTSVIELAPFRRFVGDVLSDDEREEFIDYIARHSEAGPIIQETGGARKVRWSRDGAGKRGGVRVIYYYHVSAAPIFLITIYPKNVKDNLTNDEKQAIKAVLGTIKTQLRSSSSAQQESDHAAKHRKRDPGGAE
jgi:hypothetical protein